MNICDAMKNNVRMEEVGYLFFIHPINNKGLKVMGDAIANDRLTQFPSFWVCIYVASEKHHNCENLLRVIFPFRNPSRRK